LIDSQRSLQEVVGPILASECTHCRQIR